MTGTGSGLLGGIPRVVVQISALTLKGPLTVGRRCGLQCFELMGITRRMIDNGKKITFYFLQMFENVQFFSHLHFKIAKSAIMTQKIFV